MLELWLQPVDETSVRWAKGYSQILDDHETERWQRYRNRESQDLFLLAHVATRHILSHYDERPAASWRFNPGTNGRPEIVDGPADLRFNISHTEGTGVAGTGVEGMVAVLVHGDADCGVDVEHVDRPIDIASVSRRVFTADERAAVFAQPPESQSDRFYQLWTLKEAFIKAKGKGLSMPLQQFGFAIGDDRIEFSCEPAIDHAPGEWRFSTDRTESGHIVSVASHRSPGETELSVVHRHLGI